MKREEMQMQLQVQAANDARQAELDRQKMQLDVLKMEKEFEFKVWEAQFNAEQSLKLETMRTQPQVDSGNELKSMSELVKQLHANASSPREVVRDASGKVVGIKSASGVQQVKRDEHGRVTGVH